MVQAWSITHTGIMIDGSKAFFHATSADLNKLKTKPIGKDLLDLISKRCQGIGTKVKNGQVVISNARGSLTKAAEETAANPNDMSKIFRSGKKIPGTPIQIAGHGTASAAYYNPAAGVEYTNLVGIQTPPYIALAHELCHCYHFLNGDLRDHDDEDTTMLLEEARTVGAGVFVGTRISENAIRKEWNLPLRTYYDTPGDCDNLPSAVNP